MTDSQLLRRILALETKLASLAKEVTAIKERRNYNEDVPVAHNSGMRQQVKDPVLAGMAKRKPFVSLE
jgi:hypothetical protein